MLKKATSRRSRFWWSPIQASAASLRALAASLAAAADPSTPAEVLDYLIASENLRPRLLPALLENPSISETTLTILAGTGSREVVEAMRKSDHRNAIRSHEHFDQRKAGVRLPPARRRPDRTPGELKAADAAPHRRPL